MNTDESSVSRERSGGRPRAFYPEYTDHAPAARTPSWDTATEQQITNGRTMARGLGWFSLGMGLLQVFAPTAVTEFLGVDEDHAHLVQFYGLREIASGLAIIAERTPMVGVWSRVAGDGLDLATLGAFTQESTKKGNVMVAMGMVAAIAAMDTKCAMDLSASAAEEGERRLAA